MESVSNNTTQHENRGAPQIVVDTRWRSRTKLKLTVPASNNPLKAATDIIRDLLGNIQEYGDKNACIIPWKELDAKSKDFIATAEDIPSNSTELRIYHPKLFPGRPNQENIVYTTINLGHDADFNSIKEDIKFWLMGGNHGLYYNMLQAEETEVIGWLLYSTQEIDAGALAEELLEQEGINIGLRWMTINTGVKGVIPKDHKVNALHVEAEKGKK